MFDKLTFPTALVALQNGEHVRRKAWETYAPWRRVVRTSYIEKLIISPPSVRAIPRAVSNQLPMLYGSMPPFLIVQINPDSEFEPYTPTAEDMRACDWQTIE